MFFQLSRSSVITSEAKLLLRAGRLALCAFFLLLSGGCVHKRAGEGFYLVPTYPVALEHEAVVACTPLPEPTAHALANTLNVGKARRVKFVMMTYVNNTAQTITLDASAQPTTLYSVDYLRMTSSEMRHAGIVYNVSQRLHKAGEDLLIALTACAVAISSLVLLQPAKSWGDSHEDAATRHAVGVALLLSTLFGYVLWEVVRDISTCAIGERHAVYYETHVLPYLVLNSDQKLSIAAGSRDSKLIMVAEDLSEVKLRFTHSDSTASVVSCQLAPEDITARSAKLFA